MCGRFTVGIGEIIFQSYFAKRFISTDNEKPISDCAKEGRVRFSYAYFSVR